MPAPVSCSPWRSAPRRCSAPRAGCEAWWGGTPPPPQTGCRGRRKMCKPTRRRRLEKHRETACRRPPGDREDARRAEAPEDTVLLLKNSVVFP
eukprot:gene13623-biopygen14109